ncbi:class I SAM-dependent methyltransferase [Curvivirga aplysinae]|uniref:class I SAM-dependent methyltransferase n=1 Tax=Curvivirga aplysinae TaxID=2529852 RepID=UPI0012BC9AC0|nr:class I SAM-dependent methyltransferase [Curvivirga aplysinae]MTI09336.1 hypothetical protein [Curvivirga aplysinae]
MSRLDSVIRRLKAQRACLDEATSMVDGKSGHVLELGLGNGRTYDHLREKLPNRDIYVFERQVNAHPDCIPPEDKLFLGNLEDTLLEARDKLGATADLLHSDIGTGDPDRNRKFATWLSSIYPDLMASGGVILSDQELTLDDFDQLPLPQDVQVGRYYFYQKK